MPNIDPDSSARYRYNDDDPNDPVVRDHNRRATEADYEPCVACGCNDHFAQDCRCTCHSQRTYR